jgi:hypothetical protein
VDNLEPKSPEPAPGGALQPGEATVYVSRNGRSSTLRDKERHTTNPAVEIWFDNMAIAQPILRERLSRAHVSNGTSNGAHTPPIPEEEDEEEDEEEAAREIALPTLPNDHSFVKNILEHMPIRKPEDVDDPLPLLPQDDPLPLLPDDDTTNGDGMSEEGIAAASAQQSVEQGGDGDGGTHGAEEGIAQSANEIQRRFRTSVGKQFSVVNKQQAQARKAASNKPVVDIVLSELTAALSKGFGNNKTSDADQVSPSSRPKAGFTGFQVSTAVPPHLHCESLLRLRHLHRLMGPYAVSWSFI